ncbi:MAG: Ig-like domain-containing protein [Bacteroidales bacterium]|nr:Ig-like domain-containing protein [Bacteroidales bacterium]MBK9357893.1 Ig-like domain-containing protein [Bacteroidales bacterium]
MSHLLSIHKIFHGLSTAFLLLLVACANPVSPTGGPKDTTPPSVTKSVPANQSVNFNADKVILTFDEFVTLKDVSTQLVVSPPMAEQPEFTTRGKNLIMKFKEELRTNTTYNFFFANAIVDLTESNPLAGYQFTFSTGPILDSLTIGGKLLNAFTNQPVKDAFVMLYDTVYDSVPYKTRPYYLARTGTSGEFNLNNLRDGKYLMFALTDGNADYIYNLPSEEIAFADTLISPGVPDIKPVKPDSLNKDTLKPELSKLPVYLLRRFKEADSVQKLVRASLSRENVISVVFKYPVRNPVFEALKPALTGNWNIIGHNRTLDTLTLWIPAPGADSLRMVVADSGYTRDTVELSLKPRETTSGRNRDKDKAALQPTLGLKQNISGRIKPGRVLIINFTEPVIRVDFSKIALISDSIPLKPDISFDDSVKTRLSIRYPWKEGKSYLLIINDSTFTGAFGHCNDSTGIKFSALTEAETSSLKINADIPVPGIDYIIQLLGDKEKLIEQRIINSKTSLNFSYLSPGKYRIKVIYDANRNGRWDTGDYLKKRQPEVVDYHPKEFELRANWTLEEDWAIPSPERK